MTMSNINAHNIAKYNNSKSKSNNKNYNNNIERITWNSGKNNNNNNSNNNNNNENKKINTKNERNDNSSSRGCRIYEVVEAKKCIETQIYVQTEEKGEKRQEQVSEGTAGTRRYDSVVFSLDLWSGVLNMLHQQQQQQQRRQRQKANEEKEIVKINEEEVGEQIDRKNKEKPLVVYKGRCSKLRQTWRPKSSSRTWCSIDASLWHDATFRIIAMLFVATMAISGTVGKSFIY